MSRWQALDIAMLRTEPQAEEKQNAICRYAALQRSSFRRWHRKRSGWRFRLPPPRPPGKKREQGYNAPSQRAAVRASPSSSTRLAYQPLTLCPFVEAERETARKCSLA